MFPRKVRPKYWACFNILVISNLNNLILPARGGDIIRCLLIKRENKAITASFALGTLGLEKILDTLILLIVVLFSFCFPVPPFWLKQLTLISISVLGLIVATLFIIFKKMEKFNSLILAVFRKVKLVSLGERIGTLLENFANGFKATKAPDRIAKIVVISLIVWIAEAAMTRGSA